MNRSPFGLPLIVLLAGSLLGPDPAASAKNAVRSRAPAARTGGSRAAAGGAPGGAAGRATYGYLHHGHRHRVDYPLYPFGYVSFGYTYGYPWWWWPYSYGYVLEDHTYDRYGRPVEVVGSAVLETDINPKKAAVRVDGDEVGEARDYNGRWDLMRLEPGDHRIEFEAPGYRALRLSLKTRPGRYYRMTYELERGEGIDPRSTGEAPSGAEIPAGEEMEHESGGAEDLADRFRSGAAATLRRGYLRFRVTPPDAAVYLDGEFLARADELERLHGAIPVAVGEHHVEVVRPGYRSRDVDVVVEEGESPAVEVRLAKVERPE